MERPAKRPRLLAPLDSLHHSNYNNQHVYYEGQDDELNDYEETEEEEEEEVDERAYDPEQELQIKRARAEFKLKSTFEAIFEKYGKDFGDVGDEIDMRTGEIVVNNGHLIQMRHERDAGDSQTSISEELDDDMSGSEEEDLEDEDDEDEDEEDDEGNDEPGQEDEEGDWDDENPPSDEEMVEDDMILRGFAQASQQLFHRQPLHEPGLSKDRFAARTEPRSAAVSHASVLPSTSEILAQFGPQLGPDIVKYVSKRKAPEERNIDPVWRVPDIGPAWRVPDIEPAWQVPDFESNQPPAHFRRPLVNSMVIQPELELERSPSPENAPSIWALTARKKSRKPAVRIPFSPEEDQLILDFVADARRHGMDLSKISTWKQLEAMNSRRSAKGWRQRYNTKFTYLRTTSVDESDMSTSEFGTAQIPHQRPDYGMSFARPVPPRPCRPMDAQRPARVRKPAQRDGVVSWSDAIATIASIDPVGNAGLLDDARRTGHALPHERPVPLMSSNRRHSLDGLAPRRPTEQTRGYLPRLGLQTEFLAGVEYEPALEGSFFPARGGQADQAPCPHPDCKPYTTTLYGLGRAYDEEISPMCLHLLYKHNMTPISCGELNCERTGSRGYFMEKDLVEHVKNSHPYASALRRLRGRVDPALLDPSDHLDQPRQSIEVQEHISTGRHPRDSHFMAPQRPHTSQGLTPSRRSVSGSGQDQNKTPISRARATAALESVSSLFVHPSSERDMDLSFIHPRDASSDSDVQILNENPFKNGESSKKDDARTSKGTRPEDGKIRVPLGPSLTPTASRGPRSGTDSDLPSNVRHENMTSKNTGYVNVHLENQDNRCTTSTAPNEQHSTSSCRLPAINPNSQDFSRDIHSRPPFLQSQKQSVTKNIHKPAWHVERVDRSYEFSDEEDGIRPAMRRPHTQSSLPQKTLSALTPPSSVPQSFFASAPPAKFESPKPPTILPTKGSSRSNQSIVTPSSKRHPQKSAIHNVLASDEFDELSLDEDGFILLSARTKSDKLPKIDLPVQVKREDNDIPAAPAASTKKRLFQSIEVDDEVDELAEEGPSTSTPYQSGPVLGSDTPVKSTVRNSGSTGTPRIIKPKSRRRPSGHYAFKAQPSSSLRESHRPQQLPARTNAPLLDLASRGSAKDVGTNGSRSEIPSTSQLGSSPNGRRELLAVLVTPHKETWVERTVKLEDESELNDSVATPGGTLRRCGQDGFVCGRAFCFRCQGEYDARMR